MQHELQFPTVTATGDMQYARTKNVEVLTALDNFLSYAHVPPQKIQAAANLLNRALDTGNQWLWNRVLLGLQMETARKGYRSEQAVSVLIAEQQAKARMEAFQKLADMGPKPAEEPKE